jgi:hypothetical protein
MQQCELGEYCCAGLAKLRKETGNKSIEGHLRRHEVYPSELLRGTEGAGRPASDAEDREG